MQASFVSGEISPTVLGRVDTDIYAKAAKDLTNVYVRPQGGAFRREGLAYIDETTSSAEARLIPFAFNDEQTYLLVFTNGEMKVYKSGNNTVQATVSSSPISSLTTDIVKEMNFTQSADTLILVHKDIQPIKITRTSDTAWTATTQTISNIPAHAFGSLSTSNPAGSVQPDVKTGQVVLTGTGTSFDSTYLNQYINMPKGGRIYVTAVNSTTEIEGNIVVELAATTSVATGSWELETGYEDVISATRGWARSVAFYKGRLVFGGLKERPQTILMSKVGEFFDFDLGSALDDEAIDITIDDDRVNIIHNLLPGRSLQIFTTGGEFTIRSEINDALTPSTVAAQLKKETLHGSGNRDSSTVQRVPRPISVDGSTVFAEATGAVIRQFVFSEVEQSFNADNISILSEHLISTPLAMDIRKANTDHPADFLYVVNSDGSCAVLNSLREQDLLAWSHFETDGTFEDVAVAGNETYFIVNRTVNGSTVRYIEKLDANNYMDSSVRTVAGGATTAWSGFDHLEAETVKVRGDDYILDDEVISSGALTSSESVTTLEAGLDFSASVEPLPIELVIQGESFAGEYKSLVSANINLYQSRNIVVTHGSNTYKPAFREFGADILDQPISNYTGWKKVYVGGVGRDTDIVITQEEPLEFNVLAVQYQVRV